MDTESSLLEVNTESEKHHLVLMDGSTWYVNPGELPILATWIPLETIQTRDTKDGSMFNHELTNTDGDISVRAMLIAGQ